MKPYDLTEILESWPYDSENTVRILPAVDGRLVLQVRLPLGIEQYEMEGRPDGLTPEGMESYLHLFEARIARYSAKNGSDLGFLMSSEDAREIQNEGSLYYYRYLILFQTQYYDAVIRDCEHNLQLCDLLERYCQSEEERNALIQYRPYIIRMKAAAKALAIENGEDVGDAILTIQTAIAAINGLEAIDTPAFQFERVRSVNYLQALLARIQETAPEDEFSVLNQELEAAVEREDYERAAQIRDHLAAIGSKTHTVDKDF